MKKILFFIILLFVCSPANALYTAQIKNLDRYGVSVSSDINVTCDSGKILKTTGSGAWACEDDSDGGTLSKSFVITGATTASDFGTVWRAPADLTLTAIHCNAVGGTNVVGQLQECDSVGANCADVDSDMTCTAGANVNDDGSLTNPSIDSGDYLGVKTTSVSGTNTRITWTFEYTEA